MAYSPTELKKNVVIELDGKPFKVIDYNQKVVGRGGSIVNVKVKNLIDGSVIAKTFKGQDRIEPAEVSNQTAQYLYSDNDNYFFMNPDNFEQFELPKDSLTYEAGFLKEGEMYNLQSFNGHIINLELPKNVNLTVVYCEDVVKGDTTSSVLKTVRLETGLEIKAPAFIKQGDTISVDTETLAYRERKKA